MTDADVHAQIADAHLAWLMNHHAALEADDALLGDCLPIEAPTPPEPVDDDLMGLECAA